MRLEVDAQARALYLRFRDSKVHETRPLLDHRVIVDLDEDGKLIGIEVLDENICLNESGYGSVDVAVTTTLGPEVEFDPTKMRNEDIAPKRKQAAAKTG